MDCDASDTFRPFCALEKFFDIWVFDVWNRLVVTRVDPLEQSEMTKFRSYGMNVNDTFEGV